MTEALALALGVPILSGYFLACWFFPRQSSLREAFSIKVILGTGLGLGLSSALFFLCLPLLKADRGGTIAVEISSLAIMTAVGLSFTIKRGLKKAEQKKTPPTQGWYPHLLHIFWFVVILSVFAFFFRSLRFPHGTWDAWAIWNLRARFLFRGGKQWADAFSQIYAWSHPDYPLLLSGNVARIWNYLGYESVATPIALAFLFTYSTVGLVTCLVFYLKGPIHGLMAGLILLGFSFFVRQGAAQIADVPFGFYILCTIGLFLLHAKFPESGKGLIVFAGVMAGFSGWTKNEGLLFIVSVLVSHGIITISRKGWKPYFSEATAFLAGLCPIVLLIIYFKLKFAPPNDILSSLSIRDIVGKLSDVPRYVIIGHSFATAFYKILKGKIILFVGLPLLFGFCWDKRYKTAMSYSFLTLIFMIFGYFLVYLITPHDLAWHLHTSIRRLILQLLPSAICLFFLLLPPFELERVADKE